MPAIDTVWWRPYQTVGAVSIVHVDVGPFPEAEACAQEWLHSDERARWHSFESDGPRRRFALCRSALRAILCARFGIANNDLAFGESTFGKPFALVEGNPAGISFNVSHSGAHGLIAYAPAGRLGVDVEERDSRRKIDLLMDTVFTEAEEQAIFAHQGLSRIHVFYRLWTLKEAIIKALGRSLHLDAASVSLPLAVLRGKKQCILELSQSPGVAWQIRDLGNADFAAAIAYEEEIFDSPRRTAS